MARAGASGAYGGPWRAGGRALFCRRPSVRMASSRDLAKRFLHRMRIAKDALPTGEDVRTGGAEPPCRRMTPSRSGGMP
jgi:hypothetical protein